MSTYGDGGARATAAVRLALNLASPVLRVCSWLSDPTSDLDSDPNSLQKYAGLASSGSALWTRWRWNLLSSPQVVA